MVSRMDGAAPSPRMIREDLVAAEARQGGRQAAQVKVVKVLPQVKKVMRVATEVKVVREAEEVQEATKVKGNMQEVEVKKAAKKWRWEK